MQATHLVISIEGALAIAVAILGGAFGIYRASANAHAEIRSILAAHSEKYNTINEQFNTINEQFNTVNEQFNTVNERFNTVQTQIQSVEDKVDRLREDK
ncbi:MAG: hypothetical protein OXE46_07540 [Chloroflexi bacterium]|nr:hypothetical protein [Chloroflexota bacterium]